MGNTQIDQNLFAALYMLGFNFSGGDLSSGVRGAGSGQHLASVLQEGRENANIDAGLGFIWRISDSITSWASASVAKAVSTRSKQQCGLEVGSVAMPNVDIIDGMALGTGVDLGGRIFGDGVIRTPPEIVGGGQTTDIFLTLVDA